MKVVTRGPEIRRVALNRLEANIISEYITKLPVPTYDIEFTENSTDYSRKATVCINALTNGKTLYDLLSNYPVECDFFKHKEITLQTFAWLAQIQDDYEKTFNIPTNNGPTLLNESGIMSSGSLNNSIALLRMIDEDLSFRISDSKKSGGIKYLLDTFHEHFYVIANNGTKGFRDDFVKAFSLISSLIKEGGNEHRYLRNKKLFEIMVDEGASLEQSLVWTSNLLKSYGEKLDAGALEPAEYIEDPKLLMWKLC